MKLQDYTPVFVTLPSKQVLTISAYIYTEQMFDRHTLEKIMVAPDVMESLKYSISFYYSFHKNEKRTNLSKSLRLLYYTTPFRIK
jgi:hypothetical protein